MTNADYEALIQARENIARLDEKVASMGRELGELKTAFKQQTEKLEEVLEALSEARGGWKLMMLLGGAAATFGAGLTWLAEKFFMKG